MEAQKARDNKIFVTQIVSDIPKDRRTGQFLTADQIEKRMKYVLWRISIRGSKNNLDKIEKVVYYFLDSSFKIPTVEGNRDKNFSYEVFGYGNVGVKCEIHLKDGTIKETEFEVDVGKPEKEEAIELE